MLPNPTLLRGAPLLSTFVYFTRILPGAYFFYDGILENSDLGISKARVS